MFVICEICDVSINSAEEYDRHMFGKRHQTRLNNYRERKEQSERCIFVKNFPLRTTEWEIKKYFNNFGPVSKCIFDDKQDKNKPPQFVIVEFQFAQCAQNALNYGEHVLNSTKLLVKSRDFKVLAEEPYFPWQKQKSQIESLPWKPPKTVESMGYKRKYQHLIPQEQAFQQRHYHDYVGYDQGFQQTHQQDEAFYQDDTWYVDQPQQAQQQQNQGGGSKKGKKKRKGLGTSELTTEPKVKREDVLELPVTVEKFQQEMRKTGCVGIQLEMSCLADLIQVTAEELQNRYTICRTLEDALSPFFPGVTINQFGSSVNGFGIKGCDMDVYIDITKLGIPCRSGPIPLPYTRDFRFFKKTNGPLSQEDVAKLTHFEKAKLICRILVEHAPTCKDTVVIPSHRCPVVRFTHLGSGIKCDLSIDNRLALQNTRLLQTFSLYDPRVRPLVYTVRYWAKLKEIAGNPQAGPRLSNYALTLMVIYYLNNVMPRVLPTVQQMSDLCGNDRTIINKWDCSFVAAQFLPPTMNAQTGEELLSGFFRFYADFDWLSKTVITRSGEALLTSDLTRELGFKDGFINIQDPFVLDHNISFNVNEKVRQHIITEFVIAASKTEKWHDIANAETKCLSDIFRDDIPYDLPESVLKAKVQGPQVLGEFQFVLDLKMENLTRYLTKEFGATGNTQVAWCHRMCHFVYEILERVLMFNCEVRHTNVTGKLVKSRQYKMKDRITTKKNQVDEQDDSAMTSGTKEDEISESDTAASGATPMEVTEVPPPSAQKLTYTPLPTSLAKPKGPQATVQPASSSVPATASKATSLSSQKRTYTSLPSELTGTTSQQKHSVQQKNSVQQKQPSASTSDFQQETGENYTDAEVYLDMDMEIYCRVWAERKKFLQAFKERGYVDSLELEQMVSEKLYYEHLLTAKYPFVEYRVIMKSIIKDNKASLLLDFSGDQGNKEFFCVFHYMKKFITKMADKHFC